MDLKRFIAEVRPTGGVWTFNAVVGAVQLGFVYTSDGISRIDLNEPLLLKGIGTSGCTTVTGRGDVTAFEELAPKVAYGTAVLFLSLTDEELARVNQIAAKTDFREWVRGPEFTGLPVGARTWIKSFYDGATYSTHLPYLLEAVRRTTGPVLELGAGDGSTPALHEECAKAGRQLITIDSDRNWCEKFLYLESATHAVLCSLCPSDAVLLMQPLLPKDCSPTSFGTWGVVFVDQSPGDDRLAAIEKARKRAEYIVVHDTEDLGYGLEDLLSSFKYRKDFRRARPWTTVVSDSRGIW